MASAEAEIRHVFGATCLTEGSIGAAPPDIVKLSEGHRLRSIRWFTRGNFCPPVSASDLSLYYACVNLW